MHCPQCGQRVSGEVRFCKHCGFSLDGVRELFVPAPLDSKADRSQSLLNIHVGADPRSQRGLNQAVYMLLLAFMPLLLAALQGIAGFTLIEPLTLLKIFFALLVLPVSRFAYAVYEAKRELNSGCGPTLKARAVSSLPSATGLPGDEFRRPAKVETAEMARPASVTEQTTRLLHEPTEPS